MSGTASPKATVSFDRALGATIEANRQALRLSQTELGAAIGVTFQQLQKYERGTNRVSVARLRQIARRLEIPVGELISDAEGLLGSAEAEVA